MNSNEGTCAVGVLFTVCTGPGLYSGIETHFDIEGLPGDMYIDRKKPSWVKLLKCNTSWPTIRSVWLDLYS